MTLHRMLRLFRVLNTATIRNDVILQNVPLQNHLAGSFVKCSFSSSTVSYKENDSVVKAIKTWNDENLLGFGPLLKPKSANFQKEPKEPKELSESVSSSESNNISSASSSKRGRGRPKKVTEPSPEVDGNSDAAAPVKRGRGRPKKDPFDNEKQQTGKEPSMAVNDTKNKSGVAEPITEKDVMSPGLSTILENKKPEVNLDGILFFPFIPTDRTEYYVTPPEVPEVHIPGYTERAVFEDPFFPSVGTILSTTMPIESRVALKRWKDNLVAEIGEDGFRQHRKNILDRGVNFHRCLQEFLGGEAITELSEANQGYWNSARETLSHLDEVIAVEEKVLHRNLCYKGVFDCVARYRNETVLIDWKTSKKAKAELKYTYDNPLQVAAYTGAYNFTQGRDTVIDKAVIVVCYEDGQPAHTHMLSRRLCVDYWGRWLARLHAYWAAKLGVTN